eukprot:1204957-Rhodomonas_salina.1
MQRLRKEDEEHEGAAQADDEGDEKGRLQHSKIPADQTELKADALHDAHVLGQVLRRGDVGDRRSRVREQRRGEPENNAANEKRGVGHGLGADEHEHRGQAVAEECASDHRLAAKCVLCPTRAVSACVAQHKGKSAAAGNARKDCPEMIRTRSPREGCTARPLRNQGWVSQVSRHGAGRDVGGRSRTIVDGFVQHDAVDGSAQREEHHHHVAGGAGELSDAEPRDGGALGLRVVELRQIGSIN